MILPLPIGNIAPTTSVAGENVTAAVAPSIDSMEAENTGCRYTRSPPSRVRTSEYWVSTNTCWTWWAWMTGV